MTKEEKRHTRTFTAITNQIFLLDQSKRRGSPGKNRLEYWKKDSEQSFPFLAKNWANPDILGNDNPGV
jgi:hypothetical protein